MGISLLKTMKDGGPESRVWGMFLIEWKALFSIVLLRFEDGSREAYHSHAFHAISWVLKGCMEEKRVHNPTGTCAIRRAVTQWFKPSLRPIITTRDNMHKVTSQGRTWTISFRGPWADKWREYLPASDEFVTLTHGRKVIDRERAFL